MIVFPVPVGFETYVESVIKEEMILLTGMSPTLKPEFWCPSNIIPVNSINFESKTLATAA